MRGGSAGGRVAIDFGGTDSPSSAEMTCTLICPVLRTSSWTTEPCTISNQRGRSDLPMTIWVMLLALA